MRLSGRAFCWDLSNYSLLLVLMMCKEEVVELLVIVIICSMIPKHK